MPAKNGQHNHRMIIESFEKKAYQKRSRAMKVADLLTSFFGTILFFLLNIVVFTSWILINSGKIPGIPIFDPYPYVLLITSVSLEAIVLTTIVLMSQNRQGQLSAFREELQLQLGLETEKEITKILALLNELLKKNKIDLDDPELEAMLKKLDSRYIEKKLEEQIMGKPKKNHSLPKTVSDPLVRVGEMIGQALIRK